MKDEQTRETRGQTQERTNDKANRPVDIQRDGGVKATTWRNPSENGSYYTTTFSRTYVDANGKYQDSQSFSGADLLKLSELARQSYQRTRELERDQSRGQRDSFDEDRKPPERNARRNRTR